MAKSSKTGSGTTGSEKTGATKAAKPEAAEPQPASASETLVANMRRALELKNAAPKPFRPASRTAGKGMPPLPNGENGPAASEGGKPSGERGSKSR